MCFLTDSYKGFCYLYISSSAWDCSFTHNHLQRRYNLKERFVTPLGKKKKKKIFYSVGLYFLDIIIRVEHLFRVLDHLYFLDDYQLVSIVYYSVCVICFLKYYFDFLGNLYGLWILISDVLDIFKIFKYVIKWYLENYFIILSCCSDKLIQLILAYHMW